MDVLRQLKRIPKYVSELAFWLCNTRPFIWGLLTIALVSLLWVLSSSCLERSIRFGGMGLQLVGVLLVAVGLRDTRQAFEDQPTTWQAIKQWFAGRPRFRPLRTVFAVANMTLGSDIMNARGRLGPVPNASLEDRVKRLEQQYGELFDEIGKLGAETRQKLDELSNAVQAERHEREEGDRSIREQLKKAVAGGLPLARIGAICFFIGIVAASISLEIAKWFGGGACPV